MAIGVITRALFLACLALAISTAASGTPRAEPAGGLGARTTHHVVRSRLPVGGSALHDTHLRLVVGNSPPLAVDVDSGRVSTISVPSGPANGGNVSVVGLGRAAALIGGIECRACGRNQAAFVVGASARTAMPVGQALNVAPAAAGHGWFMRKVAGRCTLRRVSSEGQTGGARPSRCAGVLEGQTRRA